MYFNNIHLFVYLFIGLLGCVVGQAIGLANERLMNHERIIEKGSLKKFKDEFVPHYGLMTVMFILYAGIVYVTGIDKSNWYVNIKLISYLILLPLLVSAFIIDLKKQIIPNRLVLTIFEAGLLITFFEGINSPTGMTLALNRFEGMAAGAGIFLIITLLGGLIAGKEAMGMGDVKLMGALGLFFGFRNIISISVLSFLLGAIISLFLLISKIKKTDEYIPFGPFIVASAILAMVIPEQVLFAQLWMFFSGQWIINKFLQ